MLNIITNVIQIWLICVMGIYFYTMIKSQRGVKNGIYKDANGELQKLRNLQKISLTPPLSEKTRPNDLSEIIGQEDGKKALKAALCGRNPQHVIIYGPPGVGKTAAARAVLKEAVKNPDSPFSECAKFVEIDATTVRFDERSIADPLIGSVHDPIYQGAGAYGPAGIPQPKAGAVTKAHGGILFIDEIGEMHPIQMNKLLKVLEDRKVYFESAYYARNNREIPLYIHEIFRNGLPADFRLVAATTRAPEEIPPALRSRCTEIYFKPLSQKHIIKICENAIQKTGLTATANVVQKISEYADNGREALNIVQTACSFAQMEKRESITHKDIEWVAEVTRCSEKKSVKLDKGKYIGKVNGLAVYGAGQGTVMQIEAEACPCSGCGTMKVTGIVESETLEMNGQTLKRESTIKASVENARTVLKEIFQVDCSKYNIHLNFPGGMPIDGPSAGVAIFVVLYSAILKIPVRNDVAFTGEISIFGGVMPVGGVYEKVIAAEEAGCAEVYIPEDNDKIFLHRREIMTYPVKSVTELVERIFIKKENDIKTESYSIKPEGILSAESMSDTILQ